MSKCRGVHLSPPGLPAALALSQCEGALISPVPLQDLHTKPGIRPPSCLTLSSPSGAGKVLVGSEAGLGTEYELKGYEAAGGRLESTLVLTLGNNSTR